MKNEWVLDVLADLRAFAQQNGLPALADQIEECWQVGAIEMASAGEEQTLYERGQAPEAGYDPGILGERNAS
jgi:hypothetical protein